ncbi:MAG: bifunctional adenosylcobinamide kinase/adenosylcobinamide-phosphate guanylyltransferase [Pleomorphochaeta sp.]
MPTIEIKNMHLYNNQVKLKSKTLYSSASDAKIETKRKAKISLLLGGCKSGKSNYAYDYALSFGYDNSQRILIATSKERVKEVSEKSKNLNVEKEDNFTIIEDELNIDYTLENLPSTSQIVIIDNISVWLTNLLDSDENVKEKEEALLEKLNNANVDIILISNVMGLGIDPNDNMENIIREVSGLFNQKLAALCDNVILMVAGLPLKIKGELL